MGPLFFGTLLILIGIGLVLKSIFNINIPMGKIIIALFFLLIGVRILIGKPHLKSHDRGDHATLFDNKTVIPNISVDNEYNIIFGNSKYDFSIYNPDSFKTTTITLNAVFSSGKIKLNPQIPVVIEGDAVFSEFTFPDGNSTFFGSANFHSEDFDPDSAYLLIKADAVFSSVEIEY